MADRLLFTKTGRARYISHLDLMRTFQRAFSRAMDTKGWGLKPSVCLMGIFALENARWKVRIRSKWEMYRARPVLENNSRSATSPPPFQQLIGSAAGAAGAAVGSGN